ncbi:response regulator transcription factor [Anaeromicropila herbilytica]|uniref:Stage 0 sporulation protein A homolog n=1 Tax=Anaeromicropila herbilytica TaxID=2785025 RepID=A0A7R7IBB9_9FIRM|nr:response regulator transcription factor [Anaeromicropila herbilytica]BCN29392.1 DNA-binding response regulator [Anaeromicropila herbilytica]
MLDDYILIVDDDRDIRNLLGIYLENEGYKFIKCDNANTALEVLKEYRVALILLDVMMPGMDGIEACMRIRQSGKMPIIFMSAKVEDMDIVQGLMAGGDDYITKPFNPIQLISRVKAQLRRYKQYNGNDFSENMLQYEDLILNTNTKQTWVNGKEIRLTSKEYEILELLLRNKGNVLSIPQIYENVWREEFCHSENTVMMHIANLRNKLKNDEESDSYIKNVWGRGYKI